MISLYVPSLRSYPTLIKLLLLQYLKFLVRDIEYVQLDNNIMPVVNKWKCSCVMENVVGQPVRLHDDFLFLLRVDRIILC